VELCQPLLTLARHFVFERLDERRLALPPGRALVLERGEGGGERAEEREERRERRGAVLVFVEVVTEVVFVEARAERVGVAIEGIGGDGGGGGVLGETFLLLFPSSVLVMDAGDQEVQV
jgi:hypothetical protein